MEYTWAQYLSFLTAVDVMDRKRRLARINDDLTVSRSDDKHYQSYRDKLEEGLFERK